MINKIHTKLYFLSLSIFIVLMDQFTKYLMFYNKTIFINKDFLLFKLDFVKITEQHLTYLVVVEYFYL